MNSRSFLTLAAIALPWFAGCAAVPRSAPAAAAERPLASPAATGDHVGNQVVRGVAGTREVTLNCVVAVQDGVMSVIGLNAVGVRLFTLRYDGQQLTEEKSFPVPEALTPRRLLADIQLVFWPLAPLQDALRPAGYEVSEPAPGTRRLRRAGRLIAEAHYAGEDPWVSRSWLSNFEFGYSLQIDSQAP